MNNLKWFKHYNTAADGQSFQLLIAEKDFETAFIYWWILEQISKFEDVSCDENRGKIILNFAFFKRELGLNFQRTERVLLKIAKTFNLKVYINLDKTIEVFAPKWLELQENRGKKKVKKNDEISLKTTQEDRSKSKDSEVEEKAKINQNNSVSNFNSRFDKSVAEWLSILEMFGFEKKMSRYVGQIKNYFDSPKDLEMFIDNITKNESCQNILKENISDAEKKFKIEKYTLVSLKKEIGVMS